MKTTLCAKVLPSDIIIIAFLTASTLIVNRNIQSTKKKIFIKHNNYQNKIIISNNTV